MNHCHYQIPNTENNDKQKINDSIPAQVVELRFRQITFDKQLFAKRLAENLSLNANTSFCSEIIDGACVFEIMLILIVNIEI